MNCIEVPVPSACLRHFSWQMRWRPYHEESKVHVGRHIWSQYSVEHLAGLSQNKWRITIRNIQTVRDPIVCFPKPAYPPKKYESMVANGILLQSSSEGHWEMAVQPWRAAKSNIEGEKEGLCWQKDFWRIKTQRIFCVPYFNLGTIPSNHDRLTGIRRWFWLMAQSTSGSGSYPRSFWSSLVGQ